MKIIINVIRELTRLITLPFILLAIGFFYLVVLWDEKYNR